MQAMVRAHRAARAATEDGEGPRMSMAMRRQLGMAPARSPSKARLRRKCGTGVTNMQSEMSVYQANHTLSGTLLFAAHGPDSTTCSCWQSLHVITCLIACSLHIAVSFEDLLSLILSLQLQWRQR